MDVQTHEVLRRAAKAFKKYDAARAAVREAEQELRLLCREYDAASGCRGIRAEALRIAMDMQLPPRGKVA